MVEEETKAKTKKEEAKIKDLVVPQLPTQEYRTFLDEDGKEVRLVTHDEALTEILETVRALKRGLL